VTTAWVFQRLENLAGISVAGNADIYGPGELSRVVDGFAIETFGDPGFCTLES
jgi:hypothetical protein